MNLCRRALHVFLAFASSSVVWTLCVAVPILAAVVFLFVPLILLAIWANISGDPVSNAAIARFATAAILVATLAFLPIMSTAILRLSLRLSPLAVGRTGRFHLVPILWLSWLLVFGLLAGSGSERITLFVAVVIVGCGMGRVYYFRRRWQGFPQGRTVLFLRRFGRTADRLVSTAVRRAVPEGASLTFLVGSRQNVASWDPLVVAFDGLRWRGLPHYLHSTDDEWVRHVREMVLQADAVVLDATDWSDALDTELAVVDGCGASDRLIVLVRHGHPEQPALQTRHQLRYRVSWRQAGHRIFWGSMFTLVPAVAGESIGWSINTRILLTLPAVIAWLLLAVRPLMDARATDELERWLAALETRPADHLTPSV
jgi:hypothetical protein